MEKSKGESMANVLKDKEGGKCTWSGLSDGESDRGGEDRQCETDGVGLCSPCEDLGLYSE